jgi:hypothetical protein
MLSRRRLYSALDKVYRRHQGYRDGTAQDGSEEVSRDGIAKVAAEEELLFDNVVAGREHNSCDMYNLVLTPPRPDNPYYPCDQSIRPQFQP